MKTTNPLSLLTCVLRRRGGEAALAPGGKAGAGHPTVGLQLTIPATGLEIRMNRRRHL